MWPESCRWLPTLSNTLPDSLVGQAERALEQLNSCFDERWHESLAALQPVWSVSPWALRSVLAMPEQFLPLLEQGFDQPRDYPELLQTIPETDDETTLMQCLRQLRRLEMVRITIRDIMGWASIEETLRDLSELSFAFVRYALEWSEQVFEGRHGVPRNSEGEKQSLVILGMGKMGGLELNFSSDIDLIFFYPESGQSDGDRALDNQEYFLRMGRLVIKLLGETTADGFVYRVDMRLRPFGKSGALALSYPALETYYQQQGREWERYAMIKAIPLTGGEQNIARLQQILKPFVFRRYLDFSAIESLRELKSMIQAQVVSKGMQANVKLGQGGIREIEFIGQAFQLIYGGRDPDLQVRGIVPVLMTLADREVLGHDVVAGLLEAYTFLRLSENRLQMVEDRQTHDLPQDELGQARLHYAMGFANWEDYLAALDRHRAFVAEQFKQIFADESQEQPADLWRLVWLEEMPEEAAVRQLEEAGYANAEQALQLLGQLRQSSLYTKCSNEARQRLDRVMPLLLKAVAAQAEPDVVLERMLKFVRGVVRRSVYLVLLAENEQALVYLVRLFAVSRWVAEQLTQHPVLLDQLLDSRLLYHIPRRPELDQALVDYLQHTPPEDAEGVMNALRKFKHGYALSVAAVDLDNKMPLMRVSDHLTELAEVCVSQAHQIAWRELTAKHGFPHAWHGGRARNPGMAVIAYGKLGGIELGYSSDLDIVFVHDSEGERQFTDGREDGKGSLDNTVFFLRLAQKVTLILSAQMLEGRLYEVDTRLRPDGASGQVVKSLAGFEQYQKEKAWTWEHQALVRARCVCGSPQVKAEFERIRKEVLCRPRALATLRQEVVDMREKMREHLGGKDGKTSLKQDRGGLTDIEFMVQFAVLGWANQYTELTQWSDNIRILETMAACDVMSQADTTILIESYRTIRAKIHRLALDGRKAVLDEVDELQPVMARVAEIWQRWMLEN